MPIPFRVRHAEWLAGIIVVLAGAAVLVVLLVLTRAQGAFQSQPSYFITVDDGHGIAPGGPVNMLGIGIGTIEAVEITGDRRVRARIEVRSEFADRIRADSVASVEVSLGLQSMLAGVGFRITPGDPSAAVLEAGAEIAAREPDRATDLLPALANDPMLDDMRALVHNARALSEQLADAQSEMRQAMTSAAALLAKIERGEGTVGRLLSDDGQLYDRIVQTMDKVDGTLDDASRTMSRSGKLLARGDELIDRADDVLKSSDEMIGSASKVFGKMDPVMDDAQQAMQNLDKAVAAFAKTTERLSKLMVKMDAVVADMARVTAATKKVWPIRRHVKE